MDAYRNNKEKIWMHIIQRDPNVLRVILTRKNKYHNYISDSAGDLTAHTVI